MGKLHHLDPAIVLLGHDHRDAMIHEFTARYATDYDILAPATTAEEERRPARVLGELRASDPEPLLERLLQVMVDA